MTLQKCNDQFLKQNVHNRFHLKCSLSMTAELFALVFTEHCIARQSGHETFSRNAFCNAILPERICCRVRARNEDELLFAAGMRRASSK